MGAGENRRTGERAKGRAGEGAGGAARDARDAKCAKDEERRERREGTKTAEAQRRGGRRRDGQRTEDE
jgi:hypothetical protein